MGKVRDGGKKKKWGGSAQLSEECGDWRRIEEEEVT